MINKIKGLVKDNLVFIIVFFLLFLSITLKLPYYIDKTGGLINLNDRIEYKNKKNFKGSINMTYVSELSGTPFNMLLSLLNNNWDIKKEEKITTDDLSYLNKVLLKESINNASINAYKKANIEIKKEHEGIYVAFVDKKADTDLKVGDKIFKINNKKISKKTNLQDIIKNYNIGDKIYIDVIRNNKIVKTTSELIKLDNEKVIGLLLVEDYDIKTGLDIKFKDNESGPSGGLMMSLAIYSIISDMDIMRGRTIAGTGTIDENGNVGPIDGIKYKLAGAVKNNANIFIVPNDTNYKEALNEKEKNNYKIEIVGVDTFDEALDYLKR